MPPVRVSHVAGAFRRTALCALLGSAVLAIPAAAADLSPAPAPLSAVVKDADQPVFYGSFYLWASALNGTISTLPPLPATSVDLSFGDILKHFDGGLMGAGEMRWGRWSVLADVMFTQVSPSGTLPGPFASNVDLRSRSLTLQGNLLYRFYDSETLGIDAGAGLRFWHLDNRLSIDPGPLPREITFSEGESWLDPVIAGRLSAKLSGPWSLTLFGDIGGFDAGSRLTWQVLGTVNYKVSDNLALRLGYRALSVDYREGAFVYDVLMQGPVFGATYQF